MSKDTCIKANTYCPVHKGIVGADCWHDSKDFSVPRTDWKQVDEITALREQVKKLENRLNKDSQEFTILCAKETEKVLREQLAALAEQNAKMREALEVANGHLICHLYNYGGSGVHQFLLDTISLPNLATPVLNRIRAEAMKLAAEILDSPMDRAAAQKIIAKAAELEKTNG